MTELELQRLAEIYENWGLKKETALQVAHELTDYYVIGAHVRDELGINEISQANPLQAAIASGAAFTIGGVLPFLVTLFFPSKTLKFWLYGSAILFLAILGALAAKKGGSSISKAVLRVTFLGTIAVVLTALVGHFFGVQLA